MRPRGFRCRPSALAIGLALATSSRLPPRAAAKSLRAEEKLPDPKAKKHPNKYDGVPIPDECRGLKPKEFDKCMQDWLAAMGEDDAGDPSSETPALSTEATDGSGGGKPVPSPSPSVSVYSAATLPTEIAAIMGLEPIQSASNAADGVSGSSAANVDDGDAKDGDQTVVSVSELIPGIGPNTNNDHPDVHQEEVAAEAPKEDVEVAVVDSQNSEEDVEVAETDSHHQAEDLDQVVSSSDNSGEDDASPVYTGTSHSKGNDSSEDSASVDAISPGGHDKQVMYYEFDLPSFDMTITIYSVPRTNLRSEDSIKRDGTVEGGQETESSFARQYELAAAKKHLHNAYRRICADQPLVALNLSFESDGETTLTQSTLRHSTFRGIVGFEYLPDASCAMPSQKMVEDATLNAFIGEANKENFLQMFHSFLVDDEGEGPANISSLYDVTVRRSSDELDATLDVNGLEKAPSAPESPLDTTVSTPVLPQQSTASTDPASEATNSKLMALAVLSGLMIVVALASLAVFMRRYLKARSSNLEYSAHFDDGADVVLFENDEEGQHQYDMNELATGVDGTHEPVNDYDDGGSEPSSISSNQPDDRPPLQFAPSYLDSIKEQSLDGNGSGTWSFSAIGATESEKNAVPEQACNDNSSIASLGKSVDFFRSVMQFDEGGMPLQADDVTDEDKSEVVNENDLLRGWKDGTNISATAKDHLEHQGDDEPTSSGLLRGGDDTSSFHSSFLGYVNDDTSQCTNGDDRGSFIREILSRTDDDAQEDEEAKEAVV